MQLGLWILISFDAQGLFPYSNDGQIFALQALSTQCQSEPYSFADRRCVSPDAQTPGFSGPGVKVNEKLFKEAKSKPALTSLLACFSWKVGNET